MRLPRNRIFWGLAAVLLAGISACERPPASGSATTAKATAKNVILMIGDGMGHAAVTAARLHAHGAAGKLALDTLPVRGVMTTYSANNLITDSAAAATAMATGRKTNNHLIGMTPDGQPLRSVMSAARERGLCTGLVVTSSITHATPAPFAAHVMHRREELAIAPQLLANKVDVLLGGGRKFFLPQSAGGAREDGRDLLAEARQLGYEVLSGTDPLAGVEQLAPHKKILGLFADDGLTTEPPEPALAAMTRAALAQCHKNRDGFLLLVEGSQIDWAGHKNNPAAIMRQTLLFDDAVKVAADFTARNGETLLIITADHETGGMAINSGTLDGRQLDIGWTTLQHTAVDVPVYAAGAGARDLGGTLDNTDIAFIIARHLGLSGFSR